MLLIAKPMRGWEFSGFRRWGKPAMVCLSYLEKALKCFEILCHLSITFVKLVLLRGVRPCWPALIVAGCCANIAVRLLFVLSVQSGSGHTECDMGSNISTRRRILPESVPGSPPPACSCCDASCFLWAQCLALAGRGLEGGEASLMGGQHLGLEYFVVYC